MLVIKSYYQERDFTSNFDHKTILDIYVSSTLYFIMYLINLISMILITILRVRYGYHFTDEKTETA